MARPKNNNLDLNDVSDIQSNEVDDSFITPSGNVFNPDLQIGQNNMQLEVGVLSGLEESPEEKQQRLLMASKIQKQQKIQKEAKNRFSNDMEYQYLQSGKYRPLVIVNHKGRKEHAMVLRQHNDTAFSYIVMSDFDRIDLKYLRSFYVQAKSTRRAVHDLMNRVTLKNGNNALEYFLHRAYHVGYLSSMDVADSLTGTSY